MKNRIFLFFVLAFALVLAACGNENDSGTETPSGEEVPPVDEEENNDSDDTQEDGLAGNITVDLTNQDGQSIGKAELSQTAKGVVINLDASGLPAGEFGFHIHEHGQCETPDFKSAGDHFNPKDASHGTDHEEGPHAGDLPNLVVGDDGTVQEEITAKHVTLETGVENSLIDGEGTALVIHEGADDYESQPSGDAGDRMVCGVIGE